MNSCTAVRVVVVTVALYAPVACASSARTTDGAGEPGVATAAPVSAGRAGMATLPSGRGFILELAITPEEQSRGYMYRQEIRDDEGMLFMTERPAIRRFWMKNCLVPIDMIWLDQRFRVVGIEHSAPPCREEPCPSFGPFVESYHVLELRGGMAAAEKLVVGDRIHIVLDPENSDR